jgi:hypothetical protein
MSDSPPPRALHGVQISAVDRGRARDFYRAYIGCAANGEPQWTRFLSFDQRGAQRPGSSSSQNGKARLVDNCVVYRVPPSLFERARSELTPVRRSSPFTDEVFYALDSEDNVLGFEQCSTSTPEISRVEATCAVREDAAAVYGDALGLGTPEIGQLGGEVPYAWFPLQGEPPQGLLLLETATYISDPGFRVTLRAEPGQQPRFKAEMLGPTAVLADHELRETIRAGNRSWELLTDRGPNVSMVGL